MTPSLDLDKIEQAEKAALIAEPTPFDPTPHANWTREFNELVTPSVVLELIARLREAEKDAADAERYRLLRDANTGPSKIWELISDDCQPPYMTLKCGADLDAAIDAMKETK